MYSCEDRRKNSRSHRAHRTSPRPGDSALRGTPSVITLIATFCNRFRYVPEVVCSIQGQDYPDLHMIFIDNASTDETSQFLKDVTALYKNIELIQHGTNIGKPRAVYDCIVNRVNTPFILLVDGDVCFTSHRTISMLKQAFDALSKKQDKLALLGPRYLPVVASDVCYPPDCDVERGTFIEAGQYTFFIMTNLNVAGGCQLIRRDYFLQVGGWEKGEHLYGFDDVNLFERLRKQNLLSAYVNEVYVKHLGDQDWLFFTEWQKIKTQAHKSALRGKIFTDNRNYME